MCVSERERESQTDGQRRIFIEIFEEQIFPVKNEGPLAGELVGTFTAGVDPIKVE